MSFSRFGVAPVVAALVLTALVTAGCGSSRDNSPTEAFTQLQRLVPVEQGIPVLLFVYTDG